ncbi:hypothetical protein Tco_0450020 [Tanacetum coccineum]
MSTMADNVIADNRPPMLNKSQYNSWQSRMLLYIKGKEHGKQLYDSVINGPFKYRTVEVPRTPTTPASIRDITYDDLTEAKNIREACDIRATNIVLQGLPQDVYNLVNHHTYAKEIWDRTDAGDVARDNATRTRVILNTRMLLQTSHRLFDATTAEVKVILPRCSSNDKPMLSSKPYGIDDSILTLMIHTIEVQPFMTKLSDYGFDVLFNTMFEQNVQEMQYSEQPVIDDDSTIENISDNNVISFDQYLKETENEVVQSTTSPYQQNAVIIANYFKDVMCTAMHADIKHNCVLPANDNNLAYTELEKSYIAEYSKVLELKAELVEKKDMIEQDVFIELSKSYSKLEKQCISLEIALQQSKDKFQNDKPCENHDAPEFCEFFEINELKAQLQAKNTKSAS